MSADAETAACLDVICAVVGSACALAVRLRGQAHRRRAGSHRRTDSKPKPKSLRSSLAEEHVREDDRRRRQRGRQQYHHHHEGGRSHAQLFEDECGDFFRGFLALDDLD